MLNVINESNAARRELTRPGKEAYLLNKKVKPLKKIIVDNEASRKLVANWENASSFEDDKGDATGKILLDPTPKGYGSYGVWQSVRGKAGMYPDIIKDGDTKWAFIEVWLSEDGAKKLQNNIVPIYSDFVKGGDKLFYGGRETRRRQALKYKHSNKEEL